MQRKKASRNFLEQFKGGGRGIRCMTVWCVKGIIWPADVSQGGLIASMPISYLIVRLD